MSSRRDRFIDEKYHRIRQHYGRTCLDVGAGGGEFAALLAGDGRDVTAVDVQLRGHTAHSIQRFDGVHLPFADKSFETAVAMFVLHHASDQDKLLHELGRVARRVIIGEDVLSNPIERLLGWIHIKSSGWGGSLRGFRTDLQWRAAFAALGWRVIEAVPIPRLKSLVYPVPRRVYVLETTADPSLRSG